MGKSRSGYKRPYGGYRGPSGVKIEIKTQEVYRLLQEVAKRNSCTIGQYAEHQLKYALSGVPYIPQPRPIKTSTAVKRLRSFQLPETLYEEVERRHGEEKAMEWIKKTVLALAQIEAVAMRGEQVEHEWREKYRV